MYYIGLMSGTSMDAVDAVLAEIDQQSLNIINYQQLPIPPEIQSAIRSVNMELTILELSRLDAMMGELFAESVIELLNQCDMDASLITAIGSHGQTVLHQPGGDYPRTLQIGDPSIISVRTGITTVADFRRADMAAGGQGAPLAPAFHNWKFRDQSINRVVLNLGGMANITVLPADIERQVLGFDTGPGNSLMDGWTQRHLHRDYDSDGDWARGGQCREDLLRFLIQDPYFAMAPPKSTGKDDFNLDWLQQYLAALGTEIAHADVQRTLLELSAQTICHGIQAHGQGTTEVLACGGGIHNSLLMERLTALMPGVTIASTGKYGINPDAVEAITFAWLAMCRIQNIPGNLPSVTGADRSILLGGVYQA